MDASAIVELLLRRDRWEAVAALTLGRGQVLHAPPLLDAEVTQVFRRFELSGMLAEDRAEEALDDLRALRLVRHAHEPLLGRVWELRRNLSTHDGLYVALAEGLGVPLITLDRRIAEAPGHGADVRVPRPESGP